MIQLECRESLARQSDQYDIFNEVRDQGLANVKPISVPIISRMLDILHWIVEVFIDMSS